MSQELFDNMCATYAGAPVALRNTVISAMTVLIEQKCDVVIAKTLIDESYVFEVKTQADFIALSDIECADGSEIVVMCGKSEIYSGPIASGIDPWPVRMCPYQPIYIFVRSADKSPCAFTANATHIYLLEKLANKMCGQIECDLWKIRKRSVYAQDRPQVASMEIMGMGIHSNKKPGNKKSKKERTQKKEERRKKKVKGGKKKINL